MPELDLLLAAAYENGQQLGRVVRWLLLLAVGYKLLRRVLDGSWGPGFRQSPLGTGVALVAVAAGLVGSVVYDFGGRADASAGRDMNAARADVVRGCMDTGGSAAACGCYADEILNRTGRDPAQFAALERDMIARQDAGQQPPQLVIDASQACAGRG